MANNTKKSVAFFERGSWYHRTKELLEDNSIKYGKVGGFKTKEEAEESYYKYREEFEKQSVIKNIYDDNLLLKDYLIYWFDNVYSPVIQPTTRMLTAYVIYNLIIPSIDSNIKLKFVTTECIDSLLKTINPICKSAANKSREVLHQAMQSAVYEEIITENPVTNAKRYSRKRKKITIYSEDELKRFLCIAKKDNWYLEILLALFLGLRKGEILALKFEDINFQKRTISIKRQISISAKLKENKEKVGYRVEEYKLVEKDPKTVHGFRKMKVPKVIMQEIEKRKELIETRKNNNPKYNDNGYICAKENGEIRNPGGLNSYLDKICSQNGLRKITVHGLRHMFATILIENGTPLVKISGLLGHSSVNTTFIFYCDVMEEINRINAFMNQNFRVKIGETDEI